MFQAVTAGTVVCDEHRCIDMTNFASSSQNNNSNNINNINSNPTSSNGGNNNNNNSCAGNIGSNSSSSSNSSTGGDVTSLGGVVAGTILEVQGCFIKSEVTSIKSELGSSTTMRRLLECEHCHKFFTSRFNLQRHQLIHTGAKPYECPLCQQRFNQSGHVKTHLRTRHPNHDQILQEPITLQEQQQQQQQQHRTSNDEQHISLAHQQQHQNEHSSSSSSQKEQSIGDDGSVSQQHSNEHVVTHTIQHSDHVTATHTIQRSEHL